jgi:1-deoxy-D-xylulose-5-phosphate reductoisomerase
MHSPARRIAILGSTGSIGQSTLDVVRHSRGQFAVVALTANRSCQELCQQAAEFAPRFVVVTDDEQARSFDWSGLPRGTELLTGQRGVEKVVKLPEVDMVVSAVVGSAGLTGTWVALDAGKNVALANKETLVMAGPLVTRLAADRGAKILPVDSEHSAVFQLLNSSPHAPREEPKQTGNSPVYGGLIARSEMAAVRRIILTASGGPFRDWSRSEMESATVADALAHPTWQMGKKITIDSATMMNKALEIIEARWLFDLPPSQIDVVIHPQSIVHSLVEFIDGSVLAQLSPPDMRLPIQVALTWPQRTCGPSRLLDWTMAQRLEFEPPDEDRFPALRLGREVAAQGGTAGAVLNAANEAAVASFLAGELSFVEIVPACQSVLESHSFSPAPTLDELLTVDRWARQEISRWICA